MKLSDRDLGFILVGFAIVGASVYATVSRTGAPGTDTAGMAPPKQGRSLAAASLNLSTQSLSANVNMLGIDAKGGLTLQSRLLHGFVSDVNAPVQALAVPNQQLTDCRHRYPTATGTNISTLIHHGYSPLMVPSRSDYDWIVNPPSEAMV